MARPLTTNVGMEPAKYAKVDRAITKQLSRIAAEEAKLDQIIRGARTSNDPEDPAASLHQLATTLGISREAVRRRYPPLDETSVGDDR